MKIITGDVFKAKCQYLMHVANLFHTWGAGFVVPLKKLYPEAFEADKQTKKGDGHKLGYYSSAVVNNGQLNIINLYAQTGIGNNGDPLNRNLQYDFLYDSVYRLCKEISLNDTKESIVIACPKIGCGLGGGTWSIIQAILQAIELDFPRIEFHVYVLPE